MKIKKIFEDEDYELSVDDQLQDISTIFDEYISDVKYSTYTNREIEIEDSGKYFVLEIYGGLDMDNANDIKSLNYLINKNLEQIELLKRLKISFKRLEYLNYTWHVWITQEGFKIEINKKY